MMKELSAGVVLALAIAAAAPAEAQVQVEVAQEQPQAGLDSGGVALGATGPSVGLRLGYGSDIEGFTLNPFGFAIGLAFDYASPNVPLFVGAEFDYYVGESISSSGFEISQNVMHAAIWFGYNRIIGRRFVLRPAMGLGAETLRTKVGSASDGDTGVLIGFQGHGLFYVTDRVFIDALLRFTIGIHPDLDDALGGLQFMIGGGYAF